MQTTKMMLVGIASVVGSTTVWASSDPSQVVHHCISPQGRAVYQDQPCEQTGLRSAKRKAPEQLDSLPREITGPVRPAQAQPQPPRPPSMPPAVRQPRTV
jgi:hypothetical protein